MWKMGVLIKIENWSAGLKSTLLLNDLEVQTIDFYKVWNQPKELLETKIEVFVHHKKAILSNRKEKKVQKLVSKSSDFHEIDNFINRCMKN